MFKLALIFFVLSNLSFSSEKSTVPNLKHLDWSKYNDYVEIYKESITNKDFQRALQAVCLFYKYEQCSKIEIVPKDKKRGTNIFYKAYTKTVDLITGNETGVNHEPAPAYTRYSSVGQRVEINESLFTHTNFGKVGFTVGHEMTHLDDTFGSKLTGAMGILLPIDSKYYSSELAIAVAEYDAYSWEVNNCHMFDIGMSDITTSYQTFIRYYNHLLKFYTDIQYVKEKIKGNAIVLVEEETEVENYKMDYSDQIFANKCRIQFLERDVETNEHKELELERTKKTLKQLREESL